MSTFLLHDEYMCAHFSASFVAIGEGAGSRHATYNPYTLKELAQQAHNCFLHHQVMSTCDTKPPEMSGGRPLPVSAPQTVGGVDVLPHETNGGRPLPVSAPQTVGGVDVQLRETSGGRPLPVSAPQTVGGVEVQLRETSRPLSVLGGHHPSNHCRVVGASLLLEVTVAITVVWIQYLRAIDKLQSSR